MTLPFEIAHYRVTSKIGEGGMGEVYRATDTKLGRDVAIKILPLAFARDATRIERFQREAQVLASLNHPNIAAIYGVEEYALVMELVEGPTLDERIEKGPMPVDEALAVARQIADALEYAHERGIVHRDLKPANIKLTSEGRIKVLDFGLAKALASESVAGRPESSLTLTIESTAVGTILGTAAYMSPEQARGQAVDRRADIWAFGALLFEMLTGRRAFAGNSVADILASVLNSEPNYSLSPPNLPPRIKYLLTRCLRKKASERLRDIGEARIWIDEAEDQAPEPLPGARRGRRIALIALVASAAFAAGVLLESHPLWTNRGQSSSAWKGTFLGGPSQALGPRISPDGKTLAFQTLVNGLVQVAIMKPETGNWAVLTREREHGPVQEIAWSPDATRLYFSRVLGGMRGIYSIPVLGGEEHLVLDGASNPVMVADGSLLVLKIDAKRRLQIHHFWPETGKLEPFAAEVRYDDISLPLRAFPDGKEAAYFGWPVVGEQTEAGNLYALDLVTGKSRRLAPNVAIPAMGTEVIGFPMAITPDGQKVLLRVPGGDMQTIVAIPRSGNGGLETWLNLTQDLWYLDAGPDGSLYMDQLLVRPEVLRFPVSGGRPERLSRDIVLGPVLENPDGSLLASSVFAGHKRVAMEQPGADLLPVSETREETGPSITKVGERAVAFPLGPPGKMVIAIASLPDGRIVKRLPVPGGMVSDLASSPDGRKIFCVLGQKIWSLPVEGGEPASIADGDSVAAGPEQIVLTSNASDGFQLLQIPQGGRAPVKVPLSSGAVLTGVKLHPMAVGPGGRVVLMVNEPHMWFYRTATVDLKTGRLNLIPVDYSGDIWYPGWTPDGKIIATGVQYNFSLWQMRR